MTEMGEFNQIEVLSCGRLGNEMIFTRANIKQGFEAAETEDLRIKLTDRNGNGIFSITLSVNTHASKTQESNSGTIPNAVTPVHDGDVSSRPVAGNRPEATAVGELKERIASNSQVRRLRAFQDFADNSPRVQRRRQWQPTAANQASPLHSIDRTHTQHRGVEQRSSILTLSSTPVAQSVVQAQFDVTPDDSMIGRQVVVAVDDCSEYGQTGTVERHSIRRPGYWTVRMDDDHDLVRFPPAHLRLASNDGAAPETNAVEAGLPDRDAYRVYRSRAVGGDWTRLELEKQADGSLMAADGTRYRLLNIPYGSDKPFVSREAEKEDARPTPEFLAFLGRFGFTNVGAGTVQDRLHTAVVAAHRDPRDIATLIQFLRIEQNCKWYTSNIRQGGLNELILTSDSVDAIRRAGEDAGRDKVGWMHGRPYTFVQLQRDTSYPTKDFVFKGTFHKPDGQYQNSHVNARMYYIDAEGKKHRTVGPVSPEYHLSMVQESLKFHFDARTTMKSLVYDLIELHKRFLATKSHILSVKASDRGSQVYEMRGGDILHLNNEAHLVIFADIVHNHTNSVIAKLRAIHESLEYPPDGASSPRPPLSPTAYPSVMSPGGLDDVEAAAAGGGR